MKKIIHMSDLHIGYRDFRNRFKIIIDDLKSEISSKASQYVVVISGDLVNNANKKGSYQDARKGLDYLRRSGFKDVLVVPGNHDYGTGNKGNKKFVRLFKDMFYGSDREYPKVDIISGTAFIGLDSMAAELEWYNELWAQGQLGQDQLGKLGRLLEQDKIKACAKRVIYLHHHPFKWRPLHELKDSRKLKNVLTRAMDQGVSIDALLFGHNHEGNAHNGKWGIPRCYDAGTATLKPRAGYLRWAKWFKVRSSVRIIDLNKSPENDVLLLSRYRETKVKQNIQMKRDLGEQPIARIMARQGLTAQDLVAVSTRQITHKMVSRACKGRRLTPKVQLKIREALNSAAGKEYPLEKLFNY